MNITRENMGKNSWLDTMMLPENLIPNKEQFMQLWNLHPEEHAEVLIYGKRVPIPRWQRSYGRDYKFSGVVSKGYEIPPELIPYISWANSLGYGAFSDVHPDAPSGAFDEILLNWYSNGENYIGSHSDDETSLRKGSPIVTITLCDTEDLSILRKFRIRSKDESKKVVKDVLTSNGMVLVMGGDFQKEFKHEIVKMTGEVAKKAAPRISITLRQFV